MYPMGACESVGQGKPHWKVLQATKTTLQRRRFPAPPSEINTALTGQENDQVWF